MSLEDTEAQSLLSRSREALSQPGQATPRIRALLAILAVDTIDLLSAEQRRELLLAAGERMANDTISDEILLLAARHFPELAIDMLGKGANGRAADPSVPHASGVMQYLLEHATALADTYGASQAQDLLRRALPMTYPCGNGRLIYDILIEAESNGWVMALAIDALKLHAGAAQELLVACVLSQAPAPSLVEMAIAHGADLFAPFQWADDAPGVSVIEYAQQHPTPWATEVFNRFSAAQQAQALHAQQTTELASTAVARRRF